MVREGWGFIYGGRGPNTKGLGGEDKKQREKNLGNGGAQRADSQAWA